MALVVVPALFEEVIPGVEVVLVVSVLACTDQEEIGVVVEVIAVVGANSSASQIATGSIKLSAH